MCFAEGFFCNDMENYHPSMSLLKITFDGDISKCNITTGVNFATLKKRGGQPVVTLSFVYQNFPA